MDKYIKNTFIGVIIFLLFISLTIIVVFSFSDGLFYKKVGSDSIYDSQFERNKTITVEVNSSDVYFENIISDKLRIVAYGNDIGEINVSDGEEIHIKKLTANCNKCNDKLYIYLPIDYTGNITIKGNSSKIYVKNELDVDLSITTVSGDIDITKVNSLTATTGSGNITVDESSSVLINTDSGEVDLENVSNIAVNTQTGDIWLENINLKSDGYINSSTGTINLSNIEANVKHNDNYLKKEGIYTLDIQTTGEIELN